MLEPRRKFAISKRAVFPPRVSSCSVLVKGNRISKAGDFSAFHVIVLVGVSPNWPDQHKRGHGREPLWPHPHTGLHQPDTIALLPVNRRQSGAQPSELSVISVILSLSDELEPTTKHLDVCLPLVGGCCFGRTFASPVDRRVCRTVTADIVVRAGHGYGLDRDNRLCPMVYLAAKTCNREPGLFLSSLLSKP